MSHKPIGEVERSKSVQNFLDGFAEKNFGMTVKMAHEKHVCLFCGKGIKEFKDNLSAKEYSITGSCQQCQDEMESEDD